MVANLYEAARGVQGKPRCRCMDFILDVYRIERAALDADVPGQEVQARPVTLLQL